MEKLFSIPMRISVIVISISPRSVVENSGAPEVLFTLMTIIPMSLIPPLLVGDVSDESDVIRGNPKILVSFHSGLFEGETLVLFLYDDISLPICAVNKHIFIHLRINVEILIPEVSSGTRVKNTP
jgi:hypothetical protein